MSGLSISRKREQSSPSIKSSHCIFLLLGIFFLCFFFCMSKFPSFRCHRDFSLAPKVHLILLFIIFFFFFKERKKKTNCRKAGVHLALDFTFSSLSFSFLRSYELHLHDSRAVICVCFCCTNERASSPGHFLFSASPPHFYCMYQRERKSQEQKHPIVLILLFLCPSLL